MSTRNRISDAELARLLSGHDEPSVLEKEDLFERIVARVAPVRQAKRWPWLAPSAAVAAAAAALVAVLVVRSKQGGEAEGAGEFLARGNIGQSTAGSGALELACVADGRASPCRVGAKLTFSVSAPVQAPHFASFGRRQDGAIVWYLPGPGGRSVRVARATSPVLLDTAFVLDETHGAGPITVFGVFSAEPLSRARIKSALGPDLRGDGSVSVVVRTLEVAAR